jgi:hypothetical protein
MNEQFESLPFAAERGTQTECEAECEAEWEWQMEGELDGEMASERGWGGPRGPSRGMGRGMARQRAMPRARPKSRPQPLARSKSPPPLQPQRYGWPRRPRPRPVFGPYYGAGWPYAVPVDAYPQPYPQPYPEPFPYPEPQPRADGDGDGDGGADELGEVPPTIAPAVARLPARQRPPYQALGAIGGALGNPAASGPGLYLIEFTVNNQPRAYSGQTKDLRRRLQQHLLCAQMMGLSLANHQVYVAQMPTLSDPRRRALEKRIHTDMLANNANVLTNQRREMEQELLGDEW